jgi:putative intracellular protease/amidase
MKEKTSKQPEVGLTRRGFIKRSAGAVIAASCLPAIDLSASGSKAHAAQDAAKKYVCPPCGLDCDKLTFDKPGNCPQCGMTLVPLGGEGGPPTVAILLFNGAQLIDFAGPWEVFGTAGFLVHTVADSLEPHVMVFGEKVIADYTFENSPKSDVLLVPGGGVGQAAQDARLIQWIRTKSKDVSYVMSVCTGAFLLAKAGLLDGLTATTTYGMENELAKAEKNIKVVYPRRFVDAGKVITTAGLSSGIDGALHVVSRIAGKGEAQSAALGMEYRWSANGNFSRAALADRYLPDGLQFGRAKIKGVEAKMISTEGDTDGWNTKILVSDPKTPAEIADLVRKRIAAGAGVGSAPTSHMRREPQMNLKFGPPNSSSSQIRWSFTDGQGRRWSGAGIVERAPDDKGSFILTLRVARDGTRATGRARSALS